MSPSFDGTVWALAASGSTVFAGGSFTGANGGTTRNHLAAVDATTGAVTAWDANVDDVVYGLALSGPTLYTVGAFARVNGNTILRGDAAAFDTTTGIATAWNPRAGGITRAVAVDGGTVYVGGNFDRVNDSNTVRHGLACVDADLDTGRATSWAPQLGSQDPGPATSVAVKASSVYAGGSFTAARTGTPHRLAAWDATTGASIGFDPDVNDTVNAIAVSGSTVWTATALQFSVAVDWRRRDGVEPGHGHRRRRAVHGHRVASICLAGRLPDRRGDRRPHEQLRTSRSCPRR
jgi:hypothetical protein